MRISRGRLFNEQTQKLEKLYFLLFKIALDSLFIEGGCIAVLADTPQTVSETPQTVAGSARRRGGL